MRRAGKRRCPGAARGDKPRSILRDLGRPADAITCLQPVYDRFTEGFGTADLMAAKAASRCAEPRRLAARGL